MNLFDRFTSRRNKTELQLLKQQVNDLQQKAQNVSISLTDNSGKFWQTIGNTEVMIEMNSAISFEYAYKYCAPVTSIINLASKPFANGKWQIKNMNDEVVSGVKDIETLLQKPNPLQSWAQFITQHKILKRTYGNGFILKVVPVGFNTPMMLWNIPNQYLNVTERMQMPFFSQSLNDMIENVYIQYNAQRAPIEIENLLIMRDETISMNTMILSESRLRALQHPVNNIISAMRARGVLASRNGMPIGAISNETTDVGGHVPISDPEKDLLQENLSRYGLDPLLAKIIITDANIKWVPMNFATKDLLLFEEIEDDIKQICMAYEFGFALTPYGSETAFDNQEQSSRRLYQDVVIPESIQDAQAFTSFLGLDLKKLHFDVSFDHVSILQTDISKANSATKTLDEALQIEWQNDLITLNEWRLARGYETDSVNGDLKRSEYQKKLGITNTNTNNQTQTNNGTAIQE